MENKIYQEESVIIIAPLKARIFSEAYERNEYYNEAGEKVVVFREKKAEAPGPEWQSTDPEDYITVSNPGKNATGGFGVKVKE